MIDEKRIIKRAAAGDAEAFEQLVLTYQTPIYRLCLRITGNTDDAADLTQEAFLKAWRALDTFRFDASFSTWLYRLASNLCLDFLRAEKRRATLPLIQNDAEGEELALSLPDPAPTPEEATEAAQERAQISAALQSLEPQQRQILTLRVINDLSYAEIAEILGVQEGTVKSRLSRARDALRKKLQRAGTN